MNKQKKQLKVLSLFAGCGGSDLGMLGGFTYLGKKYSRLPYEISLAIDIDKKAIATYNKNFKMQCGLVKGVENVSSADIPGGVNVVIGGFPCQSFSTVNPTKDPFDERGKLYKEMARLLREIRPKAFIAENVKGMLVLKNGSIFKRIVKEFSGAGYLVSHKLINAADFGIPQRRQRVFIVGIRSDIGRQFQFPKETHAEKPVGYQKPWVGLRSVIDNLIPEDLKYFFSQRAIMGMRKAKKNMKRGLWQDLALPSLTVTSHLAKVSINSRDPVLLVNSKKDLYRRFTPREAARIQSFPDNFIFVGSDGDAYRQIGEAVAPVVMWHLSKHLADHIKSN